MTEPIGPVVCIGDVMVDVVARLSGPLNHGSDAPGRVSVSPGGSAANVASWLADAGTASAFVGRMGDDAGGRDSVAALRAAGVEVHAAVDDARATGTCIVLVHPDGERSMVPDAGANAALSEEDLPLRVLDSGRHLHVSGYALLSEGARPATLAAIDRVRDRGITWSVDPSSAAPLAAIGAQSFLDWTTGVDLILANVAEAAVLTGLDDPEAAALRLAAAGGDVVVKLGAAGALWARAGAAVIHMPARPAHVVDTTGAGDAFAAGFLSAWLTPVRTPRNALESGCRLAARAVAIVGARPAPRVRR
jgi:sugar/nucleoside kinase (ribokinase family)